MLSSQIEGTQSSLHDLLAAEARILSADAPADVDENSNYVAAMLHGLDRLDEIPVSGRMLRELHERLLRGVRGQGGGDMLIGSVGADRLFGGEGLDMLVGGAGADYLEGGQGADVFRWDRLDESSFTRIDVVADFDAAEDALDFAGFDFTFDEFVIEEVNDETEVSISGTDFIIRLLGDGLGLTEANFLLPEFEVGTTMTVWPIGSTPPIGAENATALVMSSDSYLTTSDLSKFGVSVFAGGEAADNVSAGGVIDAVLMGYGGDDALIGGIGDDLIDGGDGNDTLRGGEGDDTLDAGANEGGWQFLYGGSGDDTYVYRTDAGRVMIGASAEALEDGSIDRIVLEDLQLGEVDFSYHDYGADHPHGKALRVSWTRDGESGEIRIANMGREIEEFEFADG
ncbi:MAG: Fic/DOC family N-terminal domain-containing protein, partial [Pseudomonadota bacterium]